MMPARESCAVAGVGGEQVRDDQPVLAGMQQPGRRVGEPAVVQAALEPGVDALVTQQGHGQAGLQQRLTEVR